MLHTGPAVVMYIRYTVVDVKVLVPVRFLINDFVLLYLHSAFHARFRQRIPKLTSHSIINV